jgi:hypothetical protein
METHDILVNIKSSLDRLIMNEFPEIRKGLYEQDLRLRHLEISQIKLDMMGPKIDSIDNHLKSIGDLVDKKSKPINDKVEKLEGQIDELRAYMWKTVGAMTVIATVIPFLVSKFVT